MTMFTGNGSDIIQDSSQEVGNWKWWGTCVGSLLTTCDNGTVDDNGECASHSLTRFSIYVSQNGNAYVFTIVIPPKLSKVCTNILVLQS